MNVLQDLMVRRLAYQLAAADLARAARDFAGAAHRVTETAKAFDTAGETEDAAVMTLVEATGGLLALAAHTSPGIRALMIDAVAGSEPQQQQQQTEEQG